MFKHEKQLFHPVEVERPNLQYAVLLQEQLGGKRKKFNVYAETREQCEIKLAEMIERVKAEIAEEKAKS